ncbi:DUF4386 domain-containing protein [Panacibacter sp. DH6]|uniref:DUF4386 domain-containing protein n=1 Tax=Panacibacter microcysteis TaxID=2793269 RepID=A0A931MC74_9BACT|nr:DUF4386 domain-containing protein [Panacibacter microcysteis]MBG9377946.1 DUF4386 domain-containing protein [Panacibacter microcysteis]
MDTSIQHARLVKTARIAGLWYLLLAVSGVFGFMVFHPRIFVGDDPQQTLNNVIDLAPVARTRLFFELLIIVAQALTAVWFYKLFCGINRWAALVLAIWGTVNAVIIMVSATSMSAIIDIAGSSFSTPREKIIGVQILMGIIANAWSVGGLFFGLWLLPMGYMVITSRSMPLWLGRILIAGGAGYLLQTCLNCAGFQSAYTGMLVIPATAGEFWMIAYLLVYGIRAVPVGSRA